MTEKQNKKYLDEINYFRGLALIGGVILYTRWVLSEIRNIKNAIYYTASQILKSIPFMWGFLQPKKNPTTYPSDVKLIK